MTALRFGLDVSTSAAADADPVADAQAAEELGFDFVSASDHPSGTHPTYETWTMLTWIAAATSRVRVATRVLGVPYRSPAMLAKMAESLDRLSGGRLILGLGGGASDEEFRSYGLPVRTPREKVDALAEAVRVIRGLWTQPRLTYEGEHYRTEDAPLEPKPTRPIPIWLGTFGRRSLAITGELADGWIPSLDHAGPDRIAGMHHQVADAARAAGRDPADLTYACNLTVRVTDGDPTEADIAGSIGVVTKQLADLVAIGFDAFNLMPVGDGRARQVELLATEVVPRTRRAVE
ncbi:MAG TPA: LLM class flavin-dependent oxidoreductase [Nocardioidaceae bacterium]|nr:LLM class flavin-dependent oxidoreductase [Nocardioidaceae bacterium]